MAWPTTDKPRKNFVTIRLTDDEEADVRWLVAATGAKDRSAAVRKAVDRVIAAEKRKARKTRAASTPGPGMRDEDG